MNARLFLLPDEAELLPTVAQDRLPVSDRVSDSETNRVSAADYTIHTKPEFLADDELDSFILHCARQFLGSHAKGDEGRAEAWYRMEAHALVERGSRPHIVARMERRLGLA